EGNETAACRTRVRRYRRLRSIAGAAGAQSVGTTAIAIELGLVASGLALTGLAALAIIVPVTCAAPIVGVLGGWALVKAIDRRRAQHVIEAHPEGWPERIVHTEAERNAGVDLP